MRRYGSSKRNPNPKWPGVQTPIVIPPGTNAAAVGRVDKAQEEDVIKITDKEVESTQDADKLFPIMGYVTGGGVAMPDNIGTYKSDCKNMSVSEYLCDKTGSYARVELLFGENTHIEKTGMLECVGRDFVVLTEAGTGSHMLCFAKNIKFINIYNVK